MRIQFFWSLRQSDTPFDVIISALSLKSLIRMLKKLLPLLKDKHTWSGSQVEHRIDLDNISTRRLQKIPFSFSGHEKGLVSFCYINNYQSAKTPQ